MDEASEGVNEVLLMSSNTDQTTVVVEMKSSSAAEEEAAADDKDVCANCGIAGVDNIKLKTCGGGCDLVKYCSTKCRGEHREQHKEGCKKRANKLHDDDLFRQPDGIHRGECPICFLPMTLDKNVFYTCCSEWICQGCIRTHMISSGEKRCPFCRAPQVLDKEESKKRQMKRIEANDPAALCFRGKMCKQEGDCDTAFEYYSKAAELGDADAQYFLGRMYWQGESVEKDEEKAVYHLEKAAISGHPQARQNLAAVEAENGNMGRAVKHMIIAAKLGFDYSMKQLLSMYKDGYITKDEYGATLRTHQAAIDATKSEQRDAADEVIRKAMLERGGKLEA